jgi:nucleoside 2-deoxyribosyltransferase
MQKNKPAIYLASPYGFTDAGRDFMKNTMIPSIKEVVGPILNPWDGFDSASREIKKISSLNDIKKQNRLLRALNEKIGRNNEESIWKADIVVAILDGSDIDSGVAAEVGYAFALNKKILGYRSDFRLTGDNSAAVVNVQVEYFISKSGGKIVGRTPDLIRELQKNKIIH